MNGSAGRGIHRRMHKAKIGNIEIPKCLQNKFNLQCTFSIILKIAIVDSFQDNPRSLNKLL